MQLEFEVSRQAVLDERLFDLAPWGEVGEAIGYDVSEMIPAAASPDRVVSLFMADCAAVRAIHRCEDGRKAAAILVIRPTLSHEPDDVLIELARDELTRKITSVYDLGERKAA